MENDNLFNLIDAAYAEDLSDQPKQYKEGLLNVAKNLSSGVDEVNVCIAIYALYHDNYMVPMSFPKANRILYQYVQDKLKKLNQEELRNVNLGYGLVATHFTFSPFN